MSDQGNQANSVLASFLGRNKPSVQAEPDDVVQRASDLIVPADDDTSSSSDTLPSPSAETEDDATESELADSIELSRYSRWLTLLRNTKLRVLLGSVVVLIILGLVLNLSIDEDAERGDTAHALSSVSAEPGPSASEADQSPSIDSSKWQPLDEPAPPVFSDYTESKSDPIPLVPAKHATLGRSSAASPLTDGDVAKTGSSEPQDITTDSAPMRDRSISRVVEIKGVDERLSAIESSVGELREEVKVAAGVLNQVADNVLRVSSQVVKFAPSQESASTPKNKRPDIQVEIIASPKSCLGCVPYAEISYNGKSVAIADGDSFEEFNVKIAGNRIVLSNDDVAYSYFVPK